jgi:hypothetical protein
MKVAVLFNTIYFGCIIDSTYNEDKIFKFLEDILTEFSKIYKGNLSFVLK